MSGLWWGSSEKTCFGQTSGSLFDRTEYSTEQYLHFFQLKFFENIIKYKKMSIDKIIISKGKIILIILILYRYKVKKINIIR